MSCRVCDQTNTICEVCLRRELGIEPATSVDDVLDRVGLPADLRNADPECVPAEVRGARLEDEALGFVGRSGRGKSWPMSVLFSEAAQRFIDNDDTGVDEARMAWANVADLAERWRSEIGNADTVSISRWLIDADVLVLDDVAAARNTPFVTERLYHLIERRIAAGRHTSWTVDVPLSKLEARDADWARITSRLVGGTRVVVVEGGQRRQPAQVVRTGGAA